LELRGIPFHEQVRLQVTYEEIIAGECRDEEIVDDKVIIKIKSAKALTEIDEAQLINYLNGTGYKVGLLINPSVGTGQCFGASSLEQIRRVVLSGNHRSPTPKAGL
jgi:GxxExxY protein